MLKRFRCKVDERQYEAPMRPSPIVALVREADPAERELAAALRLA